jgi:hypothetical protein
MDPGLKLAVVTRLLCPVSTPSSFFKESCMRMPNILRELAIFIFLAYSFSAHAEDSDLENLRKEIRELHQTVQKLSAIVENQNTRIEELKHQTVPQKKAPQEKPISTASAVPETSNSQEEIQSLLNQVENAPATPGANTATIGPYRVPTGGSTPWKLIPDISVISTFAGSYFTEDPTGDLGVDPSRTGFTFQELELSFQSVVDPYFRYDAFLSFSEEGVEIEEAYFTTLEGPPRGLQFLGGKFRLPFGRQNPKHLHAWSFADNNLVNKYLLGGDGLKEVGLELAYLFPTPFFFQFQGNFTNGDNETSFGGTQKQDFLYQGRLSGSTDLTSSLTLLVGGSYAYGFNSTGNGNNTQLYGGDFLLKWKPSSYRSLSWQTEYIGRQEQTPDGSFNDGGLYSYIDYQFLKRWTLGLRYDQVGIPGGLVAREFRLTPAFTFRPTEFSQIRLQYEYDKIAEQEAIQAAILQFEFSFGVHGAHPF